MEITKTSVLTGVVHTIDIDVSEEQIHRWEQGELIQEVMPNLSPEDREFLISGIIPEEWNNAFPDNYD